MVARVPESGERLQFRTLQRGDQLPPLQIEFDADDVRAYLEATGEPAERWTDVVPPLALGALVFGALLEYMPLPDGAVHVSQEFDFLHAVTPGEPTEARITAAQRSERAGSIVVIFAIEVHAGGRLVMDGRATVMAPAVAAA